MRSNAVEQIWKVSKLVDRPMSARPAHILMMLSSSYVPIVCLHRPCEERARAGRAIYIGIVVSATLAEPVRCLRSTAHRPAHPVDGPWSHSRARRTFLDGENGGACAGMPTHMPAHARVHVQCQARTALTICAVAMRRQGATVTPPTASSPALSLGPLQLLCRMFVPQPFRGLVLGSRVPQKACSQLCV